MSRTPGRGCENRSKECHSTCVSLETNHPTRFSDVSFIQITAGFGASDDRLKEEL